MKEKLNQYIDNIRTELTEISDYIFDHPETAFEEVKASNVLTNYLEKNGFSVERGVGSLNTAFRAVYENGTGGPSIGLLCEYDALSGMGHACGHHMQGPAIAGAAVAVKELYRDKPYKLVIYGTPGEEGKGGKLFMLADGAFKDIDIALMTHAGPATQTDIKSMASASISWKKRPRRFEPGYRQKRLGCLAAVLPGGRVPEGTCKRGYTDALCGFQWGRPL